MSVDYESQIAALTQPGTGKFAVAKGLVRTSEEQPELLVPHFGTFCHLLEAENSIIRWSAIRIVANLAAADRRLRLDRILDRYLAPILGPAMITATTTIQGAARIARSRKRLAPRLVMAMLQVERGNYQTAECRNIAIGHALKALSTLDPTMSRAQEVLSFAERQFDNPRPGTRRLAAAFLKPMTRGPSNAGSAHSHNWSTRYRRSLKLQAVHKITLFR